MTKQELLDKLAESDACGLPNTYMLEHLLGKFHVYKDPHNECIFVQCDDALGVVTSILHGEHHHDPDFFRPEDMKWGEAAKAEASRCADAHERAMKVLIRMQTGVGYQMFEGMDDQK